MTVAQPHLSEIADHAAAIADAYSAQRPFSTVNQWEHGQGSDRERMNFWHHYLPTVAN